MRAALHGRGMSSAWNGAVKFGQLGREGGIYRPALIGQ